MPYNQAEDPTTLLWYRLRDDAKNVTLPMLTAIADAAAPAMMARLSEMPPLSTMAWAIDYLIGATNHRRWLVASAHFCRKCTQRLCNRIGDNLEFERRTDPCRAADACAVCGGECPLRVNRVGLALRR
jgi:hypothetical protein